MGYSKVTGTVQYLHHVEQNGSDFPKSEIQKQIKKFRILNQGLGDQD